MTIAKKPVRNQSDIVAKSADQAAEAFISKAGKPAQKQQTTSRTPVLLRFNDLLLERIDAAAQRRSVKRTQWIQYVITRALEEEGE
jgi:hypothetical protein